MLAGSVHHGDQRVLGGGDLGGGLGDPVEHVEAAPGSGQGKGPNLLCLAEGGASVEAGSTQRRGADPQDRGELAGRALDRGRRVEAAHRHCWRVGSHRVNGSLTPAGRRSGPAPPASETILASALRAHRVAQTHQRLAAAAWLDEDLTFTSSVGTVLDQRNVLRKWKLLCANAGVSRNVWLHQLRHSAASFLLVQGTPMKVIQEILRHSRMSTASDLYAHVPDELQRAAMSGMDAFLRELSEVGTQVGGATPTAPRCGADERDALAGGGVTGWARRRSSSGSFGAPASPVHGVSKRLWSGRLRHRARFAQLDPNAGPARARRGSPYGRAHGAWVRGEGVRPERGASQLTHPGAEKALVAGRSTDAHECRRPHDLRRAICDREGVAQHGTLGWLQHRLQHGAKSITCA